MRVDLWFRIQDPTVAKLHHENAFLAELKATEREQTLEVFGILDGYETGLEAYAGHPDDPASTKLGDLPIKVGGRLQVFYDQPPTFSIDPLSGALADALVGGGAGVPPPEPLTGGEEPNWQGPIELGLDGLFFQPELIEAENGSQAANFEFVLLDKDGRPKKGKRLAVVFAEGRLTTLTQFVTVNDQGAFQRRPGHC